MMVFLEIINKTGLVLNVNVFLTIISETFKKKKSSNVISLFI